MAKVYQPEIFVDCCSAFRSSGLQPDLVALEVAIDTLFKVMLNVV